LEAFLDSEPNRLEEPFREMLFRQTRGHPLFTAELLRGLQERGDVHKDRDDHWVEAPMLDWETLPARVEAVFAERTGRLAQPLQAILKVACVEGGVFTAEVVARVRTADEREILESLSNELDRRHRLIRAHSIQRIDGQLLSTYRFRHILFQKYLYGSLDGVERVHLHDRVGTALETLYGSQDHVATVAPQLALHFQEAQNAGKAIDYLHMAGERAIHLSAYQEAITHLTGGLDLLKALPGSANREQRSERRRRELALQVSLGIASKPDIPEPPGELALTRARELCQQIGTTSQLCRVVGELAIFPYVRAEYEAARELGDEALALAQQAGDPLLLSLAHWHLGYVLFGLGEFAAAQAHLEQVASFYQPRAHHHSLVYLRGSDPGVSAMAYDACCLWCLGYPEQATKRSLAALALAQELDHAFTLADVLCFAGCVFNEMVRDVHALKMTAERLIAVSEETGFRSFAGTGTCYQGEALARMGHLRRGIATIQEGLAVRQSVGALCYQTGIMGALAEALASAGQPTEGLPTLAKAINLVEETGERYYEAELYRQKGEILLAQGAEGAPEVRLLEAERCFRQAIKVARRQQARSWELRATTSLARVWQARGSREEAREMLTEIYSWFTEGFDTRDLLEAKALLDDLA
jgi:predicted ATPase